jgi:4-amino-4-deoxy-L-arabinose transferase-like glycosyltransferase
MAPIMSEAGYPPTSGRSTPCAAALLLACALPAALVFWRLGALDLWDPDEANYAEVAREMAASGDWIVPHSNYRPYLEKPPLAFWIAAAAMRLAGPSETAARLPAALAGAALVAAAVVWARRACPAAASAAALATGTNFGFLATSRLGILDLPFTAGLTISLLGFERRVLGGGGRGAWLAMIVGLAAACLAKGPAALVLAAVPAAIAASRAHPPDLWRRLDPPRALALFLAIAAPWYAAIEARAPGFLRSFLIEHHWERYVGEGIVHRNPLPRGAAIPLLLLAGLPWSALWPAALRTAWRRARGGDGAAVLLGAAALFPVLFFEASATRLPQYLLPCLPPLSLLTARWWVGGGRRPASAWLLAAAAAALFLFVEAHWAAPLNARQSLRPLVAEAVARARPGEAILSYRLGRPYASVFYARRRVRFMEEEAAFDAFLGSSRRWWVLIDEPDLRALERRLGRAFPILAEHAGRFLITNRPPS